GGGGAGARGAAEAEYLPPFPLPPEEEAVRRLAVAVDDPLLGGGGEGGGHLPRHRDGLVEAKAARLEARPQVLALQPLHDQEELVVGEAVADVAHDGGVAQRRQRLRLAFEAAALDLARLRRLDGPRGAGPGVDAVVDDARAAAPGIALDLEATLEDVARLHGLMMPQSRIRFVGATRIGHVAVVPEPFLRNEARRLR